MLKNDKNILFLTISFCYGWIVIVTFADIKKPNIL